MLKSAAHEPIAPDEGEIADDWSSMGFENTTGYVPASADFGTLSPPEGGRYDTTLKERREGGLEEEVYDVDAWRARRVGALIASEPEMTLTLLSFLASGEPILVDELLGMGPKTRLFETLFSLYDLGLLSRTGANLFTSEQGREVIERLDIPRR